MSDSPKTPQTCPSPQPPVVAKNPTNPLFSGVSGVRPLNSLFLINKREITRGVRRGVRVESEGESDAEF